MAVAYQYKVEGINCMNCANGIKSHLSKKNITKVNIDIAKGVVTVYNNEYAANEIEQFINDLGYKTAFFRDEVKQSYRLEYYLIISALRKFMSILPKESLRFTIMNMPPMKLSNSSMIWAIKQHFLETR